MKNNWSALSKTLTEVLGLSTPPIAITFSENAPSGVKNFDAPMAQPADDGRTGRVPAGCVFWMKASDRTFSTVAQDHGNCSVGSLTHGFKTIEEVAGNSDVAALIDSGWVTLDVVPQIPTVTKKPGAITYGPLAESPFDPDVVLLRVNPKQVMVIHDAWPKMHLEGKPQCHIVAIAKEKGEVAASVGCALSRVRTGMSVHEMTCAIPASLLSEVIEALVSTSSADNLVARYAGTDALRFA